MKAFITFDLNLQRYEYDGALPVAVIEGAAALLDDQGYWIGGYPAELASQAKEPRDALPTALWEIEHVGGRVVEIHGQRPSGAILEEDWKNPQIN